MNKIALALFSGIVIGCVTTKFVPLEIPNAHAKVKQQWEYWCVTGDEVIGKRYIENDVEGWNIFLNKAGKQGWELMDSTIIGGGSGNLGACFKRPGT
ncbi:MAG: hypothetical protein HRU19_27730 [Pseudobacteriovorax sp.]|nr:hypothetical protein [Pseudobacteriovorax sp.]